MKKSGKISVAMFEVLLVIISILAFSYFVGFNDKNFALVSASVEGDAFQNFLDTFELEDFDFSAYSTASGASESGCCLVANDNDICATSSPENCAGTSPFVEGIICDEADFCEKGCCYDEDTGVYDKNVLNLTCDKEWINDPNCNIPDAEKGCCVLGSESVYETEAQCETDTLTRAMGDDETVDWYSSDEVSCLVYSSTQEEGACLTGGGSCKFLTENDCSDSGGDYYPGYLCTSESLNTSCEMTEETTCADEKDQVYFVDSCGNYANVYDSSRVNDADYWDTVVEINESCGADDTDTASANSKSCGNCDRFAGSICSSASDDSFSVDVGDYYCADMSCQYDGKDYENGESWCVYDGAIGNGDDVVGSRHWKYVCSQGVVQVEPCSDYRNEICVLSEGTEVDGEEVEFSNAACIANNWRECLSLNSDDDDEAIDECGDTLNCMVQSVEVSEDFKFDVCVPKYPGGFSLDDERYTSTADSICEMATQNCTVVQEPKTWGGCKYVANEECLEGTTFAEQMNEFCRKLGDCGGEVNIVGAYTENYAVKKDGEVDKEMYLGEGWIEGLMGLAEAVEGQYASVEDYSEYLDASGIWGEAGDAPNPDEDNTAELLEIAAAGVGGLAMALKYAAGTKWGEGILGYRVVQSEIPLFPANPTASLNPAGTPITSTSTPYISGFAGAAMGASIGMAAGAWLADTMDLSSGGSMLMTVGGALLGGSIGYMLVMGFSGYGAAIAAVGVVLMLFGSFFGSDDCDPVYVSFECRAWEAPSGGDSCEKCNDDPLKPCSEYRCKSLGASCEIINEGSDEELCVDGAPENDGAPVISRDESVADEGVTYEDNSNGFSIMGEDDGCLDANTALTFGITTNEPAMCRFDVENQVSFDDMGTPFGSSSYLYNHTTSFSLPSPSELENLSVDWDGEMSLYVICKDRSGVESEGTYQIDFRISDAPDTSAPTILSVDSSGNGLVGYDSDSSDISVITNELSQCRWSYEDTNYWDMENDLNCNDELLSPSSSLGYLCTGEVSFEGDTQSYYIRCIDQPWVSETNDRNANTESYVFTLSRPDSKIFIESVYPSEDIEVGTDTTTINLEVSTSGGGSYHYCSYSLSGYEDMIQMFESGNSRTHSQSLNMGPGDVKIYVECEDETGDYDRNSTEFKISQDTSSSQISRIWQSGGSINLALTEEGECRYSNDNCNFAWSTGNMIGEGIELSFSVKAGTKYYIRCKDEYGNSPKGCSVELVAL